MKTPYDINQELRAHRRIRVFARIGCIVAAFVIAFGFGCSFASLDWHQIAQQCAIGLVLVWGAWGLHFLTTRH